MLLLNLQVFHYRNLVQRNWNFTRTIDYPVETNHIWLWFHLTFLHLTNFLSRSLPSVYVVSRVQLYLMHYLHYQTIFMITKIFKTQYFIPLLEKYRKTVLRFSLLKLNNTSLLNLICDCLFKIKNLPMSCFSSFLRCTPWLSKFSKVFARAEWR